MTAGPPGSLPCYSGSFGSHCVKPSDACTSDTCFLIATLFLPGPGDALAGSKVALRLAAILRGLRVSENGGLLAGRLRTMRSDPERGSIGGQWPEPTADNCTQCAIDIQKIIGGDRAVLEPAGGAPRLGPSTNDPYGNWTYHEFVIKNGVAYDGFTGRAGMKFSDFLRQFEYGSDLNFRILP